MASVLGVIGNSFLRPKNFLYKKIVNEIRKYTAVEITEHCNNQHKEFIEIMTPLLEADDLSQDLCLHVRNEIINKHIIPEEAVDTRILDVCLKVKKCQIAKAYVNCLQSNGFSINMYALVRYLDMYRIEKPASSFEENEIINIFERIQKEYEHIPPVIMKNCIIALCQTHKWRLTIDLIKDYADNNEMTNLVTRYIIPTAFRNGEISVGLKLLNEMDDPSDSNNNSDMYKEYLNNYLQNEPAELYTAIEKIFTFWRKYDIVPTKYIIDMFVNAYNTAGWEAKYVTIKQDGNCSCCGNQLSDMTTNDIAFKKLAKNIIAKAIIATDIFQNTTPLELQRFKNFVHKNKPFDIVIDGLNVVRGSQNIKSLKKLVDHFSKDNKKILIIARKHLSQVTRWIKALDNVNIFFLENVTNDDPYVLYATLMSGNNSKFVTIDLLRQHIHKLNSRKLRRKFKRWQYTHQYSCHYSSGNDEITLIEPWLYEPFAQYNNGYWHIPYRMDTEKLKLLSKPVDTWICFRSPQK